MKRFFALLAATFVLLASCGKADVVIRTDLENTRGSAYSMTEATTVMTAATNEAGLMIFVLNASSKTFHVSEECRYAASMSAKNKVFYSAESIYAMVALGYEPCSVCIGDGNNDQKD